MKYKIFLCLVRCCEKGIVLKNILTILFIAFVSQVYATKPIEKIKYDSTLVDDEKRIALKVKELIETRFDDEQMNAKADDLMADFESVLKKEGSFYYAFDSLFPMGKVVSEDGLLRVFTWYSILANGNHIQYGLLQYNSREKKEVLLYPLVDKSEEIEEPQTASLSNDNWYGATYYEIVESKSAYGKLYVLLGWDGNSIYSNKKVVESLVFTESGRPKFGKPVFVADRSKVKRIVFEYSRMASMMLKYSPEFEMIVMDHLSPSQPIYNGNRHYYGPDLSYDGLKFEDGLWRYYPTINYKPELTKKRGRR